MTTGSEQRYLGAARGVRLHLTLLFLDLCGSSRLAEQLDAEQIADVLAALRGVFRSVVPRHGGLIARMQGDGALAVFGYPAPDENDARRAAEAALEIHATVEGLDDFGLPAALRPLQMHSGIHSGLVLVSDGDIELGRIELIGDAPNTAARLAALAPAGVIFADTEALGPHSHFFQLERPEVLQLPGRSAAVRVVRVRGRSGIHRRFDASAQRGLTPLVGREPVLDIVAQALRDAARLLQARHLCLRGQAGIGKTRLLEEMARLAETDGFECLRGFCESYLGAEVLQPFAQIERAMGAAAHPGQAVPERPATSMASRVLEDLAALAARRPVLLLLDDWQWADDASRQLLGALLKLRLPFVVVLAMRPMPDEPAVPEGADLIELPPFTVRETQSTIARWLPRADPFVVAEIHQYAGGVPLLVEELCHSFVAHGAVGAPGARAGNSGWLSAVVASRLGRLPELQQYLVRVAAVLGRVFSQALFARVAMLDSVERELAALADADFIFPVEAGMLRFKHGLTRDAVFETVALKERRAIHLRVMAVLAEQADLQPGVEMLEALSYHARGANLWAEAARYCELAGDKAAEAFAFDRARAQYLAALDSLDRIGPLVREDTLHWCALAHKLGMTCIFDPLALPDALRLFERCITLARVTDDALTLAKSQYWMGYMCYGVGLPRAAAVHCRAALVGAQAIRDERLAAQVEATLGQALAAACVYDESLPLMERALGTKRQGVRAGSRVAVGSAFTLATKASILADRGEFAGAHLALDEARSLLGASDHPVANSVRNWAMVILAWQGRWDAAIGAADEGMRIAESARALMPLAISRAVGGYARWMRDGRAADFEQIAEAVHWMEQRRGNFFTSIYYGWLVEACADQQRIAETRHFAARVFTRARAGELLGETAGCRALALVSQLQDQAAATQRYLLRAQASAQRRGSRREAALNDLCHARLLGLQGQAAAAQSWAAQAREAFDAMDMHWHAAHAARSA